MRMIMNMNWYLINNKYKCITSPSFLSSRTNEKQINGIRNCCWTLLIEMAYPNAEPAINSACELITSAMNSSLNASLGLRHLRPPGNTNGRSCGVRGPPWIDLMVRFSFVFFFIHDQSLRMYRYIDKLWKGRYILIMTNLQLMICELWMCRWAKIDILQNELTTEWTYANGNMHNEQCMHT